MRSHLSIVLGSILAVALVGVASGRVSAAAPAAEETQKVVVHLSHFTGWQPGDPVIVPPPKAVADAKARLGEGYDCVAYLNGDHA